MIIKVMRKNKSQGIPKLVYARPSFLRGIARIFDFGGTLDTYYYLIDEDSGASQSTSSQYIGNPKSETQWVETLVSYEGTADRASIERDAKKEYLGMCFGFVASILLIALGTFLVYHGYDWVGTAIVVSTIACLVGAFVYADRTGRAERQRTLRSLMLPPDAAKRTDLDGQHEKDG